MRELMLFDFKEARSGFMAAAASFPSELREQRLFEDWNLKDVLAHIAVWYKYTRRELRKLRMGKRPYWGPSTDEHNRRAVAKRRDKSWNAIYREFIKEGELLTQEYQELPEELWDRRFWRSREHTPKSFLKDCINHCSKAHLPELMRV